MTMIARSRQTRPAALLLTLSTAAVPALADDVPLGASAANETVDQFSRPLAPLSGGGFAALWLSGPFDQQSLRMQWLDPEGEPVFEEDGVLVAGGEGRHIASATVTAGPLGGVFVAFGRAADPSATSVFVQSYDATGAALWPAPGIEAAPEAPPDHQGSPTLVGDGAGGVFVCFAMFTSGGVRCQHVDDRGERSWSSSGVLAGGLGELTVLPRAVGDGSGGLLVFWPNFHDTDPTTEPPTHMEGQRFDAAGNAAWGDGLLVHETDLHFDGAAGYSADFWDVVSDGAGGAIVVFNDWLDFTEPNLDVAAQRVDGTGTLLWGDGVAVIADPGAHQLEAAVAMPDGGVAVVTRETVSSTDVDLWLFRLGADGQHAWEPTGVSLSDPSSATLDYFAHGSFDQGLLRLAWTHQLFFASLEMDVQMARYRLDGTRLDPPEGQAVTAAVDGQFCHGLAHSAATGKTLVLWDDRRSGSWDDLDVYATEIAETWIFADGFESGDVATWSGSSGAD